MRRKVVHKLDGSCRNYGSSRICISVSFRERNRQHPRRSRGSLRRKYLGRSRTPMDGVFCRVGGGGRARGWCVGCAGFRGGP
ncbi:unnamed protein product [Amoebophrya sp. A120]|nr:unnamed protein product [Amoebophrya sp. A120]|eukprot:GSA120T00011477001.1